MFLSIILKFQVLDINILLGIHKKAKVFDGSWSANLVLGPRLMKGTRKVRKNAIVFQQKRNFHSISCIFFILDTVDYSFVASFYEYLMLICFSFQTTVSNTNFKFCLSYLFIYLFLLKAFFFQTLGRRRDTLSSLGINVVVIM